jgi:hypothetical protein
VNKNKSIKRLGRGCKPRPATLLFTHPLKTDQGNQRIGVLQLLSFQIFCQQYKTVYENLQDYFFQTQNPLEPDILLLKILQNLSFTIGAL